MPEPDDRKVKTGIHPRDIVDEFTFATDAKGRPLSRQRKWQLRMTALGCCTKCGQPVPEETKYTRDGWVKWKPKQCTSCRNDNRRRQQHYRIYGGNVD